MTENACIPKVPFICLFFVSITVGWKFLWKHLVTLNTFQAFHRCQINVTLTFVQSMIERSHLKAALALITLLLSVCRDTKCSRQVWGGRKGGRIYNLRDNNPIATHIYHLKEINNVQLFHVVGKVNPTSFLQWSDLLRLNAALNLDKRIEIEMPIKD
jgi:hypothetical protein